ncbi:MAG: hypothetical protein AB8I08_38530 [Sandaracinaceae bacterium]
MKVVWGVVTSVLVMLYPVAIWFALTHLSARSVSLLILGVLVPVTAVRFRRAAREDLVAVLRIPLVVLACLLLGAVLDDPRFVFVIPVLTNVALLITFASSLRETPIIERFARMQEKDGLCDGKVRHCRQVTIAWCVFFVANASVAALLAVAGSEFWWAAYNGGIAYGLMGLMFAGEYVLRAARFRSYGTGLHDRLLSRLFPPPGAARVEES